jgi:hypothetical protein
MFEQRDCRNAEVFNFNSIKQKDVGGGTEGAAV